MQIHRQRCNGCSEEHSERVWSRSVVSFSCLVQLSRSIVSFDGLVRWSYLLVSYSRWSFKSISLHVRGELAIKSKLIEVFEQFKVNWKIEFRLECLLDTLQTLFS